MHSPLSRAWQLQRIVDRAERRYFLHLRQFYTCPDEMAEAAGELRAAGLHEAAERVERAVRAWELDIPKRSIFRARSGG